MLQNTKFPNKPALKLIDDAPVTVSEKKPFENDYFNFEASVTHLCSIIKAFNSPFTIGVYGPSGAGKTSFMKMVEAVLKSDSNHVKTFFFNACQHENKKRLILPLLFKLSHSELVNQKSKTVGNIKKAATMISLKTFDADTKKPTEHNDINPKKEKKHNRSANKTTSHNMSDSIDAWVDEVGNFRDNFEKLTSEITKNNNKTRRGLTDSLTKLKKFIHKKTQDKRKIKNSTQLTHLISGLKKFIHEMTQDSHKIKNRRKLVIFIDDLDRCSPENAIQLLEDIKNFLSANHCIFVISADKKILSKFIYTKYRNDLILESEYLEKMVDFSIDIPEEKLDIQSITADTLEENVERFKDYIKKIVTEIYSEKFYTDNEERFFAFISILSFSNFINPRKIKKLLFRYSIFLMQHDFTQNKNQYNLYIVVMLLIIREYFSDIYSRNRTKFDGYFFPSCYHVESEEKEEKIDMSYNEIAVLYGKDIAELFCNHQYIFKSMQHSNKDLKIYYNLIDSLFSLKINL